MARPTEIDPTLRASVVDVLTRNRDVIFATIFGSVASGRATPTSDVDIAISGVKPLSIDARIEIATQLNHAIHREVDLIDLQVVAGEILKQALSRGEIILNRDPLLYAQLIKKLVYNQEDMMPIQRRILQYRRDKFLRGAT